MTERSYPTRVETYPESSSLNDSCWRDTVNVRSPGDLETGRFDCASILTDLAQFLGDSIVAGGGRDFSFGLADRLVAIVWPRATAAALPALLHAPPGKRRLAGSSPINSILAKQRSAVLCLADPVMDRGRRMSSRGRDCGAGGERLRIGHGTCRGCRQFAPKEGKRRPRPHHRGHAGRSSPALRHVSRQ